MATTTFLGEIKTIHSFEELAGAQYLGTPDEISSRKKTALLGGGFDLVPTLSRAISVSSIPKREDTRESLDEEWDGLKEQASVLIKGINDKLTAAKKEIDSKSANFFVRFDEIKYPGVADAVDFYTSGKSRNLVDKTVYDLAKQDYYSQLGEYKKDFQSMVSGNETAMSASQQVADIKKTNVIWLAFKVLLDHLESWFWGLPIVDSICSVLGKFGVSCHKGKKSSYGGPEGRLYIPKSRPDSISLKDVETIVGNAATILNYVRGAAMGQELYIDAEWGSNKNIFLIDYLITPVDYVFAGVANLAAPLMKDDEISAIGSRSITYSPTFNAQVSAITKDSIELKGLLQSGFLTELDMIMGRVLKILHGWYLDPRTYCCLVNAFGGISMVVPKWLEVIKHTLWVGIIMCDLDLSMSSKKLTNILNLIITSTVGSIITSIGNFIRGYVDKAEAKFMHSFLTGKSELMKCLPFDQLIVEFGFYFESLTKDLENTLREYSEYLTISNLNFSLHVGSIERRQRLEMLYDFFDRFINAWEWGYICSSKPSGTVSTDVKAERSPQLTEETYSVFPKDSKGNLLSKTAMEQPVVSRSEMSYLLRNVFELPPEITDEVIKLYDKPGAIDACLEGWGSHDLSILSKNLEKLL